MQYVIIAIIAIVIISVPVYSLILHKKIKKNGVETAAVVSQIKESHDTDTASTTYIYSVTFMTQDGKNAEAKLSGAPLNTRVGDRVRIKYLPEKPNHAVIVK